MQKKPDDSLSITVCGNSENVFYFKQNEARTESGKFLDNLNIMGSFLKKSKIKKT